jgi:hypothetical protein
MPFQRRPNSDRSPESLESRLRALPQPPVPGNLEARILAAIPGKTFNEIPRPVRGSRRRRMAVWAGAAATVAAFCLLAVRFWSGPGGENRHSLVVADSQNSESAHHVAFQQPVAFVWTTPWLKAGQDLEGMETPTYTWPIQEESPLMVSTALRPDLLD